MDEKNVTELQNELNVANMFLKAAEDVKRENAEREKRNKDKAAVAAESRRREKALDDAYAEYCRNNPPTESECREAIETIKSCIKGKGDNNDKARN